MSKNIEVFVPRHSLLLVSIKESLKTRTAYDATRYAWRIDKRKVKDGDLVLGCVDGIVEDVFVVDRWLDASPGKATEENFPGFVAKHKNSRIGFVGKEAEAEIRGYYRGKRVPDDKKTGRNPVRYIDGGKC